MILYLDSSALVKRYVVEPGSNEVNALIAQADAVGCIMSAQVEIASALARSVRMNWVDAKNAEDAWLDFLSQWQSFARLTVTPGLVERASHLAWEHGLRCINATHLAGALTWQEMLEMPITLATFDWELWLAGRKSGLAIWPEVLP